MKKEYYSNSLKSLRISQSGIPILLFILSFSLKWISLLDLVWISISLFVGIVLYAFFVQNLYPEELFSEIRRKIKTAYSKRGALVLGVDDQYIYLSNNAYKFENIRSFNAAKGGSEPYIELHNNLKIDLPISWLSKKDQVEIEQFLNRKIN